MFITHSLMRTLAEQHGGDGFDQNFQIKKDGSLFNVVHFEINPVRVIDITAARHLPPSGNARFDRQMLFAELIVLHQFVYHDGTGPHKRHGPGEDIEELGQFIEAGLS